MISSGELLEIQFQIPQAASYQYPFNLPFLRNLEKLKIHPQVTFFVGENGMGKSTLIEAIAVASGFNAEGGTKNFNFNTRASHSDLHQHIRTARGTKRHSDGFFLRSESFFNLATEIEHLDAEPGGPRIIDSYGGKSLHEQSHGESFWALFMHRLRGNGFYILDEPEAAMSPTRQMAMLCKMDELIGLGSQFIIATHSPILIAYPGSIVYEFSQTGISIKKYKETELFKSYADFIKDSDNHIRYLLKD
ncbi:AAA family ATPase [Pedobacter sp. Hv1]|uniref:AAA family ATPase n=1 Tax=Pedobacter sp. Hv1 TaxID=1740090 RepID=UPI0006D8B941|nr:AAA family ATPase [Pedobacter sp. Hv1]KQC01814.1 AAA family ATPase [Pedobacter sp. Hv1]